MPTVRGGEKKKSQTPLPKQMYMSNPWPSVFAVLSPLLSSTLKTEAHTWGSREGATRCIFFHICMYPQCRHVPISPTRSMVVAVYTFHAHCILTVVFPSSTCISMRESERHWTAGTLYYVMDWYTTPPLPTRLLNSAFALISKHLFKPT